MNGFIATVFSFLPLFSLRHQLASCMSPPGPVPTLARIGDNVSLSWTLPPDFQQEENMVNVVVSFSSPDNVLFMFSTASYITTPPPATTRPTTSTSAISTVISSSPSFTFVMGTFSEEEQQRQENHPQLQEQHHRQQHQAPAPVAFVTSLHYRPRLQMPSQLTPGLVQFTLKDVGPRDAGRYMCSKGLWAADVVHHCGKNLVIIETPSNVTVVPTGPAVLGKSFELHCHALSRSHPLDHNQPMRFRWFIRGDVASSSDWTEIVPDDESLTDVTMNSHAFLEGDRLSDEFDGSSGEADPDNYKGHHHSGSLSDVFRIETLGMSDEGRQYACIASDGMELWSSKSSTFAITLQRKPSPSDLAFTPPERSISLTLGDSAEITCDASCQPHCTIEWHKVSTDGQTLASVESSTLLLRQVGKQHQGQYRCLASNIHGSAHLALSVTVNDGPKPWFSQPKHVILVVSVGTVVLALLMVLLAVIIYRWRRHRRLVGFPHYKEHSDTVPLTVPETRPSLISYC